MSKCPPLRWREYQPAPPAKGFFATLRKFYSSSNYSVAFEEAANQLRQRPKPPSDIWGEDPLRIQVAQVILKMLQEWYEWPNDHFIPEDPFEIAFMMPWDMRQSEEVAIFFESQFNIEVVTKEFAHITGFTLADLVSLLVAKVRSLKV